MVDFFLCAEINVESFAEDENFLLCTKIESNLPQRVKLYNFERSKTIEHVPFTAPLVKFGEVLKSWIII